MHDAMCAFGRPVLLYVDQGGPVQKAGTNLGHRHGTALIDIQEHRPAKGAHRVMHPRRQRLRHRLNRLLDDEDPRTQTHFLAELGRHRGKTAVFTRRDAVDAGLFLRGPIVPPEAIMVVDDDEAASVLNDPQRLTRNGFAITV